MVCQSQLGALKNPGSQPFRIIQNQQLWIGESLGVQSPSGNLITGFHNSDILVQ
jgi:hypothetical protein